MFQEEVIQICNSFRGDDFYVSPGIPNDKLGTLALSAMLPPNTPVYALIDATVFGSAKNGMLIASTGLYFHNDSSADIPGSFFLSWDDLLRTENTMYPRHVSLGEVELTPGLQFEFSGCAMNADQLIPLLMNLRAAYRRYAGSPEAVPPPAPASSQTLPQVKCEFCNAVIAGGMTNCPSCGAPAPKPMPAPPAASVPPAVPPMPAPGGFPQASVQPNVSPRVSQKSRSQYILLACLFGGFGVHNFYAGRTGCGIAQLLITVFTFWLVIPLIAVGIWVLIEICSVTTDGDGLSFS